MVTLYHETACTRATVRWVAMSGVAMHTGAALMQPATEDSRPGMAAALGNAYHAVKLSLFTGAEHVVGGVSNVTHRWHKGLKVALGLDTPEGSGAGPGTGSGDHDSNSTNSRAAEQSTVTPGDSS